ncbi:MAG: hypothetical protein GF334_12425 [Candidatus Altiarchaeales archaeon]|nr:hypothetical protein [Candidatus Altiarchaeales archaeon]
MIVERTSVKDYPWRADNWQTYTDDGRYCKSARSSQWDLVSYLGDGNGIPPSREAFLAWAGDDPVRLPWWPPGWYAYNLRPCTRGGVMMILGHVHYKNGYTRHNKCLLWRDCWEKVDPRAPKPKSKTKPPLGVKPKWIHDKERLHELFNAILRYAEERKPIPESWASEVNDLIETIVVEAD